MAKIAAGDLPRLLGGGWKSYAAVLVHGSDEGAIRETAERLATSAAGPDADPLNLVDLDGDALAQDPPRLADEMKAFGLFGGFRVIHVRNAGRTPLGALEPLVDEPSDGALLILQAGELKPGSGLRGFAEKHRRCAVIACYADTSRTIGSLIDDMLRDNNLSIAREARQVLGSALGADRALSRSELEKLAIYAYGSESIGIDMVLDIVADAGRHDTGALIDKAFGGEIEQLEPEANRIFLAGVHPSAVLSQAIGHVFLLRRIHATSLEEVARQARLHFSRLPGIERAAARWTGARLQKALDLLADAVLQTRRNARLAESIAIRSLWATARLARS